MPDELSDLEARVSALEHDRARLYEEIGAALVLARGADRDTRDFRAALNGHNRILSALRETQLEQGDQLRSLEQRLSNGFATVAQGQAQIVELLGRLAGDTGSE